MYISTYNSEKRCHWALKLCLHINRFIIRKSIKFSFWFLLIKWYHSIINQFVELFILLHMQIQKKRTYAVLLAADFIGEIWIYFFLWKLLFGNLVLIFFLILNFLEILKYDEIVLNQKVPFFKYYFKCKPKIWWNCFKPKGTFFSNTILNVNQKYDEIVLNQKVPFFQILF